jgi:hypothetical protein
MMAAVVPDFMQHQQPNCLILKVSADLACTWTAYSTIPRVIMLQTCFLSLYTLKLYLAAAADCNRTKAIYNDQY